LRAIIFAGGKLAHPDQDRTHLRPGEWIIAADGGAHHCLALGLAPTIAIGDFDSLTPAELHSLESAGTELIRHPRHKDETDLELAVRLASGRGADEVLILGGLGERWDQSLANLLLPAAPGLERLKLRLVDGPQEITTLRGGESLALHGQPGDTVSLIPLGGDALGVTTRGLEYLLEAGTLPYGATLGVSNALTAETASVSLSKGLLLCIHIHTAAIAP
jgi:thiamine pyrophosphokinase